MLEFVLPALIGAGASIYGSNQQSKAQKRALAEQRRQYDQNQAKIQPYLEASDAALEQYRAAIGLSGPEAQAAYYEEFQNDPGFLASQEAALEGINRGAAARGQSLGGNTLAALYDYGQRNQLGQYNSRIGQLGGVIGQGVNALGTATGLGQNFANSQAGQLNALGQSQAAGTIGAANAINQGFGNYMFDQRQRERYAQGLGGGGVPMPQRNPYAQGVGGI